MSTEGTGLLRSGRRTVLFTHVHDTYAGTSPDGRAWLIRPTTTGWRLEFRDPGDTAATYAGTHPSISAAQNEARR